MKHSLLFIVAMLWVFTTQAQNEINLNAPIPLDPNVRTGTLSNGLKYYILKNKRPENRMELRLAVNAGSVLETDVQQGLAHFCEHMCFNGTKNFKKNELVDYLESIGVKFGAHLNAYTSFDETVYMFQMPTDNAETVETGFQILEDWAHNVSFDDDEIDKERGVVIEEWRLGQGADERMQKEWFPIAYAGSQYANRLPIGKKEILENFKYDEVKQFYHDWYRPDLMAVIAVGDFDVDEIEKKIKAHFGPIKNPTKEKKRTYFEIPERNEMAVKVLTDKEAWTCMVNISYQEPSFTVKNMGDYKHQMAIQLYNMMMNARMGEYQTKENPPFSYAFAYYGGNVRTRDEYAAVAYLNANTTKDALRVLLTENRRAQLYGFTPTEFERAKKEYKRSLESKYNERDKTESNRIIWQLVYAFLGDNPMPGVAFDFETGSKLVDMIALDEVNKLADTWITGKKPFILITAPEKDKDFLPSEAEVKSVYNEIQKIEISPYVDTYNDAPLMTEMPEKGKIINVNKNGPYGSVVFTLNNGAKVVYKKTDFKNDEIRFRAISPGGYYLYNDESLIPTAKSITGPISRSGLGDFDYSALQKYLSDKVVYTWPYVSNTTEGFYGNASPQDIETLMQMVYLFFTQPKIDNAAFDSYISSRKTFIQNDENSPETIFYHKLYNILSNNNPWAGYMKVDDLAKVDKEKCLELYKDRFADPGKFTFIFVGNIDEKQLASLCEQYIGALKNEVERTEDFGSKDDYYHGGVVDETVKKGVEPKSSVSIVFSGAFKYDKYNKLHGAALEKALSIRLREALREDLGGTYGVRVSVSAQRQPHENYSIEISFGCSPENVDKLVETTYRIINEMIKDGPDESEMTKFKETLIREHETNLQTNAYWERQILNYFAFGDEETDPKAYNEKVAEVTAKDVKKLAKQLLNFKSKVQVVLMPETETE
ncbi:insulinase family protein [bacterium]|nr:insulinase family protein [bacterium]